MIEHGTKVREYETQINRIKKEMKPHQEQYATAEAELLDGKPTTVKCSEIFVFDRSEVMTRREDTGEIFERREMSDDDRQQNVFDSEEEVTDGE
jgi:hypothetical protein